MDIRTTFRPIPNFPEEFQTAKIYLSLAYVERRRLHEFVQAVGNGEYLLAVPVGLLRECKFLEAAEEIKAERIRQLNAKNAVEGRPMKQSNCAVRDAGEPQEAFPAWGRDDRQ